MDDGHHLAALEPFLGVYPHSNSSSMTEVPPPTNSLVTAMLTDLYQITMAYAHWKNGRQDDPAVFELFFRKSNRACRDVRVKIR